MHKSEELLLTEERVQSKVRLAIGVVCYLIVGFVVLKTKPLTHDLILAEALATFSLIYAISFLTYVHKTDIVRPFRRVLTLILDLLVLTTCMHLMDAIVEDTGVGIPQDRLMAIFEQFEQADNSTTRKFGGTGLGLAISKQLTKLMGGDIEVSSTDGQGSTFIATFNLPLSNVEIAKVTTEPAELPDFNIRVLLAEDNIFNQQVAQQLLGKVGITADIVENGKEALDQLDRASYDLIFMDVRMPVMDGLQAAAAIRARRDEKADIPIIALTCTI